MVELLLLAPNLDHQLSLVEDEVLERALTAIGWSPSRPDDVCITTAFATVRKACSSMQDAEAFMQQRTAIIKSAGQSSLALEWFGKILGSDGLSSHESHFLQQAKSQLFD